MTMKRFQLYSILFVCAW